MKKAKYQTGNGRTPALKGDFALRYEELMEEISEGIVLSDPDSNVLFANSAAARLLGYSLEDLRRTRLFDLVHPEDRERVKNYFKLLKKKKNLTTERRIKTGEGRYISVERSAKLLPDGNVISIFRDVTERNEMERRKDTFISMASHELKTPVTSLSLYLDLLERNLRDKGGNEEALALIKLAGIQVGKQTSMINDLLDLSKIRSGKFSLVKTSFDLEELVKETADQAIAIAKKPYSFTVEGHIHSKVIADRDKIHQVLMNLFSNAIKYSPHDWRVLVHVSQKGGNVIVAVRDFGIGINKEEQKKIFNRFFRVAGEQEKTFPGLGIGLYLSREIVRAHGGKLLVESNPGEGSTFTLVLPLKEKKQ